MSDIYLPIVQSEIAVVKGSPEGILPGEVGEIVSDGVNGDLYIKKSRIEFATGWKKLDDEGTTNSDLTSWAAAGAYQVLSSNYDSDGVVTTSTVLWPDGNTGTFTTTFKNPTFLTVDAFTISHPKGTVTQTPVTRNEFGLVTVKPALTVV